MRQKLVELQGEINKPTIVVGDFVTPLSEMDRSSRQKISKDELNNTINQLDIIDVYRLLPQQQHNIHFYQAHREQSPR